MQIRFVILPLPRINQRTAKLAKKYVGKFPTFFTVDNKKLLPHVTLFVVDVPNRNLVSLKRDILVILKNYRKFPLEMGAIHAHPEGWLVWNINPSPALSSLRKQLYKASSKYSVARQGQKRRYQRHITLTKFRNPKNALIAIGRDKKVVDSFTADTVGLTISNRYSQVYKVISKIKLR